MIDYGSDNTVYLAAFWPSPETTLHTRPFIEQTYRALRCAYDCNIQIMSDPKEFLPIAGYSYVAIEEKTAFTTHIKDFVHPKKAVYIVGNSKYRWPSGHIDVQYKVHLPNAGPTPTPEGVWRHHPLYGFQAASIVLNDRIIKHGTNI